MKKRSVTSIEWHNIKIQVTHTPNKFGSVSHVELKANERLPVTETGYRSMYYESGFIEEYEKVENFVKALLDEAMKSKDWQEYVKKKAQLKLF